MSRQKSSRWLQVRHPAPVQTNPGGFNPVVVHLLDANELDRPQTLCLSANEALSLGNDLLNAVRIIQRAAVSTS